MDPGNAADDHYVVVHSAYGVTETIVSSNAENCSRQT